jgi:DNA repair protein RecN (Recombination protein N)
MLHQFVVKNYALIDELSIEWNQGFTAITGETGAGKSILLGALGLIIGNRADASSAKNPTEKVIIEASFHSTSDSFQKFFEQNDLDGEELSIVRREISKSGKSRAFINDTPVTLATLKELGSLLVDIHGQHQTLQVQDQQFQLDVVDHYSNSISLRDTYRIDFATYQKQVKELKQLEEEEARLRKEQDFIQFQFDELQEARLSEINLEQLEQELEMLSHAEEIKQEIHAVQHNVGESEQNITTLIRDSLQRVDRLANYSELLKEVSDRLRSVSIEIEDIEQELTRFVDDVHVDEERQNVLNDRLDEINRLLSKHQVQTLGELIEIRDQFENQLQTFGSLTDRMDAVSKSITALHSSLSKQASQLTKSRSKTLSKLNAEVEHLLKELGLEKAKFEVSMTQKEELGAYGQDEVSYLFSANPGRQPEPLHKVASGGEMSRCMLALKYLLSMKTALPCIVFDEIDTGVSGKVASQLASVLQQMSEHMQVICITHLPQVAGKAVDQLKVVKQVDNDNTTSQLIRLSTEERIDELAAMLSGEEKTEAALANAKELLQLS